MKVVVAIDSGTTSSRACIYDAESMIKVASSMKYNNVLLHPQPNWSEHRVTDIERAVVDSLVDVLRRFNPGDLEIIGMGVTNQRESIVAWNKETGELLHPFAICWNDRRTKDILSGVLERCPEIKKLVRDVTGLILSPYYSAAKMRWFIDNVPAVAKAIEEKNCAFGTVDCYLIYCLTGNHRSDVTNASRTMLYDIGKLEWSEALCEAFGIPADTLPTVHPSSYKFGTVRKPTRKAAVPSPNRRNKATDTASGAWGKLPAIMLGCQVTGCIGDQQAATIGHNLFTEGDTKITFGSGGFLLMNVGNKMPAELPKGCTLSPLVGTPNETWYSVEGSIGVAGIGIGWLEKLGITTPTAIATAMANCRTSEGMLFIPSFDGILSPWWDENITGTISGMSASTTKGHFIRSFLESLAVQVVAILGDMAVTGFTPKKLYLDGGLSKSDAFLQLLADFCSTALYRPPDAEMTIRGAALCAVVGAGYRTFAEFKALSAQWDVGIHVMSQKFQPSESEKVYADDVVSRWMKLLDVCRTNKM